MLDDQPQVVQQYTHKKRTVLIILGALLIVAAIVVGVIFLLPNKPSVKSGDITIGEEVITQQKVSDYTAKVEAFKASNPDAVLEGSPSDVARDDLIMNAALKNYAKQYNQTVTSRDVLNAAMYETASVAEADASIEGYLGDATSFARIRNENVAYQTKLEEYLLAKKSLFQMRITFDSPYFAQLPEGEVKTAYDRARSTLQTTILPLFEQKLSREQIAAKANVDLSDTDTTDDENYQQYFDGPVIVAAYTAEYTASTGFYNDLDDTGYVRADLGELVSMEDKVATLNNVGDYTEVFAAKTGAFVIARLEAKTGGMFNSWKDMLNKTKDQYAYTPESVVVANAVSAVQTTIGTALAHVGLSIVNLNVDKVSAADCGGHNLRYYISAWDTATQTRISGARINLTGTNYNACYGDTLNETRTTSSSGAVTVDYNCYGPGVYYNILAHPADYDFLKVRSPYSDYNTGHDGFPAWKPEETNNLGNIYIHLLYRKSWTATVTNPDSKLSVNGSDFAVKSESAPAIAKPGDKVKFQHSAKNNGSANTTADVKGTTQDKGGKTLPGLSAVLLLPVGSLMGTIGTKETGEYTVTQDDVSDTNKYCQRVNATPGGAGGGTITSTNVCFMVPFNYRLNPTMPTVQKLVEAGSTISSVGGTINNSGPTKSRANTVWQLSQVIVTTGSAKPAAINSTAPCGTSGMYNGKYLGDPAVNCKSLVQGNGSVPTAGQVVSATSVQIDNLAVGTEVCFVLSVRDAASNDANWVHSEPTCTVVGKKPKVQIHGADLSVGKKFLNQTISVQLADIITSTTVKGTATFGSWVEYGVFATGVIGSSTAPSFASGSAYGIGATAGLDGATVCMTSRLSFANATSATGCAADTVVGNYATTRSIPDVASSFPIVPTTPTYSGGSLSGLQGVYSATSDLTISGGAIAKRQWIVLNVPDAEVTITGNINYTTDPLGSVVDIPQVVIIAKNIIIADTVTKVDAWLIARADTDDQGGILNTCGLVGGATYDVEEPLTSDICKDQLTVNGPVMANTLQLRRTYGSGFGAASGDPAEVFNIRPDAYLWASARSKGSGVIRTVYSQELPPRL